MIRIPNNSESIRDEMRPLIQDRFPEIQDIISDDGSIIINFRSDCSEMRYQSIRERIEDMGFQNRRIGDGFQEGSIFLNQNGQSEEL